MKKLWFRISRNGTSNITDPQELQSLIVTNQISVVAVFSVFALGILLGIRQWNDEPIFVLSLSVIFVLIPLLINKKHFVFARLLLCYILPIAIVGMSVISKMIPGEEITESEFFDYRYVLIVTSIVPPLVFGFAKKRLLAISILPYFIAFLFFDPIHNYFNVGYYQIQHLLPSYHVSQWVAIMVFCLITIGVLVLRKTSDDVQSQNATLIQELNSANSMLESQRQKIEMAHDKIQEQNKELNSTNFQLLNEIKQANTELKESNDELVKHNNELHQFSFAISHNLRSPVASILGLIDLMEKDPTLKKSNLIEYLKKSTKILDATIKDLGMIVQIRNDIFKIRQNVHIQDIIEDLLLPFQNEIVDHGIEIKLDLGSEIIYTVKPMFVSILHNLISNAFKYYSMDRSSMIQITTRETKSEFQLVVKDNGIGIDLEIYGNDLFKLYKRFNSHTEGKGIGLYLVKLQVNSLGGSIDIKSELASFTEFDIRLPKPKDLKPQILLDEPYAKVFFDASRDLVGINWSREVNSREFRSVMNRSLDFMKEYSAAHWYLDIRNRGNVNPEDQLWLIQSILPEVFKLGLKRLVVVHKGSISKTTLDFYDLNQEVFQKYNIEINFTESRSLAYKWLDERRWLSPANP